MKSIATTAALALIVSASSSFAAGDARTPMEIARAQEACGEGQNDRIISARFEDPRIVVRCAREGAIFGGGTGAAAGAGFGGTTAAIVFTTLVLGAAAAGAGGSSSTSDTQ